MNKWSVQLLLVTIFVAACSREPLAPQPRLLSDGHIIGNGGDPIETVFDLGRTQAVRVLDVIKAVPDKRVTEKFGASALSDLKTFRDHSVALEFSVRKSPHHWNKQMPEGCPAHTCGCTLKDKPNQVFFGYDNCRTYTSQRLSGQVLMHEMFHDVLKLPCAEARRLTTLAFEIWSMVGHPDYPHWGSFAYPNDPKNLDLEMWEFPISPPVLKGNEIVYVHRKDLTHDPKTAKVSYINASTFKSRTVELTHALPRIHFGNAESFWVQKNYVALFDHDSEVHAGYRYDSERNEFATIDFDARFSDRKSLLLVETPQGVFVWGGEAYRREGPRRNLLVSDGYRHDGALYSPQTGWSLIEKAPVTESFQPWTSTAVWTGKEVLLWNGRGEGAAYDLAARSWRKISKLNQPSPRYYFSSLWNGKHLVIFGGAQGRKALTDVGLYSPETDTWTTFDTLNAPNLKTHLTYPVQWNGTKLVLFHRKFFLLDLTAKTWEPLEGPEAPFSTGGIEKFLWTGFEYLFLHERAVFYP